MIVRIFYILNIFLGILFGCDETQTYMFFNGIKIYYSPGSFVAIEADAPHSIFGQTFKIKRELANSKDQALIENNGYTIIQTDLPWVKLNISLPIISSIMTEEDIKKLITLTASLPVRKARISIHHDERNKILYHFYRRGHHLSERGLCLNHLQNIHVWELKLWIDYLKKSIPKIGSEDECFLLLLQSFLRSKTPPPVF
jgi:hypothetical protein